MPSRQDCPPPLVVVPLLPHGRAAPQCGLGGSNTVVSVAPPCDELMGEGVAAVIVRLPLLSVLLWISVVSLCHEDHNHLPI